MGGKNLRGVRPAITIGPVARKLIRAFVRSAREAESTKREQTTNDGADGDDCPAVHLERPIIKDDEAHEPNRERGHKGEQNNHAASGGSG
jgi:hypothetical protein